MRWLRIGLVYLQAAFYTFAGVMHFVSPAAYRPMMPDYLPAPDFLILLSGVAEVVVGLGLLWPRTRAWAGWGVVALLLAVWPANLHIALYNVPVFGAAEGAGVFNWVRFVFQVPLMLLAWWSTRPVDPAG
jgi:uncharacterized membrane protein